MSISTDIKYLDLAFLKIAKHVKAVMAKSVRPSLQRRARRLCYNAGPSEAYEKM